MKLNQKQIARAMKQMGMQQEEVEANLVVIHTPKGEIHVQNPSVQKVTMMGQDSFQISGTIVERSSAIDISEEDIQTVMDGANVDRETALAAIEKHNGDLASAIMEFNG